MLGWVLGCVSVVVLHVYFVETLRKLLYRMVNWDFFFFLKLFGLSLVLTIYGWNFAEHCLVLCTCWGVVFYVTKSFGAVAWMKVYMLFFLFWSMRTSKIGNELIGLMMVRTCSVWGICVVDHLSLCIWNENFLQSNAGVLSVLIPGGCKFIQG